MLFSLKPAAMEHRYHTSVELPLPNCHLIQQLSEHFFLCPSVRDLHVLRFFLKGFEYVPETCESFFVRDEFVLFDCIWVFEGEADFPFVALNAVVVGLFEGFGVDLEFCVVFLGLFDVTGVEV